MSDLRPEMAGAGTPPGGVERLHPGGQSAFASEAKQSREGRAA